MSGREDRGRRSSSRKSRDRSRSSSRKKERHGDRGHSHREDKRKSNSSSNKKEKAIKKGIEQTKSQLKSSLASAIGDLSTREPGSSDAYPRRIATEEYAADIVDSVTRQAQIERIEEPGFQPASFKSDADARRGANNNNAMAGNKPEKQAISSDHDRAMFGPMWASKEMMKKTQQAKQYQQQKGTTAIAKTGAEQAGEEPPTSRFPLAHERLSEDPEVRNQRWLQLFRERRKAAMEGTL